MNKIIDIDIVEERLFAMALFELDEKGEIMNDQEKHIETQTDFVKKLKEINRDLKANLTHDDPTPKPEPEEEKDDEGAKK